MRIVNYRRFGYVSCMIERDVLPEDLEKLLPFLRSQDLFKNLPAKEVDDLAATMKIVSVGGGELIIKQGSGDSALYIVYEGRLRVSIEDELNPGQWIDQADISPGEVVGEIALLIQSPRTANVKAVRDSVLLKLHADSFADFEKNHPDGVVQLAKTALRRAVSKKHATQAGENVATIAVAPSAESDHIPFAKRLAEELGQIKPTRLVNKESCNEHFGREIAEAKLEDEDNNLISQWLLSLEREGAFLVLVTDREMTRWTDRCLRHADRFLIAADMSLSPAHNSIEKKIFDPAAFSSWKELVFLHPSKETIGGAAKWLRSRSVNNYHHVHLDSDLKKLCRFLTGTAFGVVLSGAGTRGFAYAGVLKALEELGLQIDFIGGTSMGSVIGAGYAKFGVDRTIEICRRKNLHHIRSDYTLPLISILKGRTLTLFFKSWAESTYIEDLWTRFFCVSTNVTQLRENVHKQGLLWRSIRASTSIPGLYPPIYDEEGNMLVDGGIVNNLPVDTMRKLLGGGKILAVDCRILSKKEPSYRISEVWTSGWKVFFRRFTPWKRKENRNTIFDILRTSFSLSSFEREQRMAKEADYLLELDLSAYGMLDFPRSSDLVDVGYKLAMEKLPKILGIS